MDAAISVPQTLQNGFWPSSRFAPAVEDEYMDDGTVRKEYAEDAPFVGCRRDRPPPSFHVGRDVYARYFLVVRLTDGDLRPFWVAHAVSNPNQTLVTAIRFRFNIGGPILFSTLIQTRIFKRRECVV
jgi:hypothetical protein